MLVTGNYQRCTNCIMDTTDSKIVFYSEKVCDFAMIIKKILLNWKTGEEDNRN